MKSILPGGPVSVLHWLHATVPADSLALACRSTLEIGATEAIARGLDAGEIVADERGWIRANPLISGQRDPACRELAQHTVELALREHPSHLALRVELLCFQSWTGSPAKVEAVVLLERARLSGRGAELIGLLEAAGLVRPLLAAVPHALLRLFLEEGHCAEVRPLLPADDTILHATHALVCGNSVDAVRLLDGEGSPEARILLARAAMAHSDAARALEAIDNLDGQDLPAGLALELALVRHRVANHTADPQACDRARAGLDAAVDRASDPSLRALAVDALLREAVRVGDATAGWSWLVALRRIVAEGWAPGLADAATVHAGNLACLAGDHRALDAALAMPVASARHRTARALQRAAALMLHGSPVGALKISEVHQFGGLAAQFLAETGRYGDALERLSKSRRGYLPVSREALEAPIRQMLGESCILELPPSPLHTVSCQVYLHNSRVWLERGELEAADQALVAGRALAAAHGLVELGGHMQLCAADLAARRGQTAKAIEILDEIDALGRHPYDFLGNRVRVARARVESRVVDDAFVQQLVRQEDVVSLALAAKSRTLPADALKLRDRLPPTARALIEAMFAEVSEVEQLVVEDDARWLGLPSGKEVDLRRSGPPRRVLLALIKQREVAPGRPLDVDALIDAGWPDERIIWDAARTRLYKVIRRLRGMGVSGIETVDGGYQLTMRWEVRRIGLREVG